MYLGDIKIFVSPNGNLYGETELQVYSHISMKTENKYLKLALNMPPDVPETLCYKQFIAVINTWNKHLQDFCSISKELNIL